MTRMLLSPLTLFCVLAVGVGSLWGETILIDDFNDGDDRGWRRFDFSFGQGSPVRFETDTLAYHLTGDHPVQTGETGSIWSAWNGSSDAKYSDGFVRATVRADDNVLAYLFMRAQTGTGSAYLFGGNPAGGNFFFNKEVGGAIVDDDRFDVETPFVVGEDWIIEAGAVGGHLSMKVWPVGQDEPDMPQWSFVDPTPIGDGLFGVGTNHWTTQPPALVAATFDDVYFTVPEPSNLILAVMGLAGLLGMGRRTHS